MTGSPTYLPYRAATLACLLLAGCQTPEQVRTAAQQAAEQMIILKDSTATYVSQANRRRAQYANLLADLEAATHVAERHIALRLGELRLADSAKAALYDQLLANMESAKVDLFAFDDDRTARAAQLAADFGELDVNYAGKDDDEQAPYDIVLGHLDGLKRKLTVQERATAASAFAKELKKAYEDAQARAKKEADQAAAPQTEQEKKTAAVPSDN